MSNVDISVIVLTFFHEQYIERALNSILAQKTTYNYEIIVGDDCSKDATVDILKRYRAQHPDKIRLILNDDNIGTCQNLYNCMLACNGRYIEITAGDDMWPIQDKLQRQTDFLEQHKEYFANCVLAEGRYTDGSLTGEIYPLDKNLWGKEFPVETLLKGIPFSDAGIMIRNVMDNATAREEFSMLPKLSRYIEDLPLDFMLYDFGKVYVTDYVGYSITHRRKSDTNQHNYNSLFNGYLQAIDHIKLINNMSVYFGTRYDFSAWLVPRLADTIIAAVKFCKPSILAQIPKIKFTCWSATFFFLVKKVFRKVLEKAKLLGRFSRCR